MAAFELIEDRRADYKSSKALSLIADNAWNGGIVIGAAKPPPAGLDLNGIRGRLRPTARRSGRQDRRSHGRAGLARQPGGGARPPMTAGMVVITGSLVATVDIAPASASTLRSTASARYP